MPGRAYAAALALPLILLGASIALAPYVFELALFDAPAAGADLAPLYRRGTTTFAYTPRDLLHPEAFGRPGQFVDAVAFDVWPANEGVTRAMRRLAWVTQAGRALAGMAPDGSGSASAEAAAGEFLRVFAGPPHGARGAVIAFDVPDDSPLRSVSGVRRLFVLAVKDPDDDLLPPLRGNPARLDLALEDLFAQAAAAGISGVGIPFMPIGPRLGERSTQADAWRHVIESVDAAASRAGIRSIVFGGWGLEPANASRTDAAFRDAFRERRAALARERGAPAHEAIRLSALVMLFAFAGALKRRERFVPARALAIVVASGALAASIAALHGWAHPLLAPVVSDGAAVIVKVVVAAAAGAFMPYVVAFKPAEELRTPPTAATPHA